AFFLFFEEFALAGDVSAVALGQHVFADGRDGLASDDAATDGGLNGHFKHLARNQLAQASDQFTPAIDREVAVNDERERVDGLAGYENVEFDEVGFDIPGEVIIERSVTAGDGLQAVVEVENDFVERQLVGE